MSTTNGTLIECVTSCGPLRFLIMDAPSPSSLSAYIKEMQRNNVSHLVRVCGPTYKCEIVEKAGIAVHSWQFDDGAPPPKETCDRWLELLHSLLSAEHAAGSPPTVAIHCVAGLGRAPILVALALVELADYDPLDAIGHIRERRKGAINNVQLNWLMKYHPKRAQTKSIQCCTIC